MKEVLILTGACGVGKSTISKAWAEHKNGTAINSDYLTEWIYDSNFPHWTDEGEKFVAKLASTMALEYLKWGMSTAIENVWFPDGIEILRNEILSKTDVNFKAVWLFCERTENHKRDQLRIPEDQMKERVDIVNDQLQAAKWPDYVHKIDTTHLSVEETIQIIESL